MREGEAINTTTAALLLKNDLARAGQAVEHELPGLGQYTFDALTSWTLNVGAGAMASSTLVRRVKAGEDPYVVLPEELPKWVKGDGKVLPGEKPNDKIVILEDTNGDGRADKCSVFATNLHIPLSFEFGDGGLYVSEQPHLTFIKDTDGDEIGRAHV